MVSADLLSYIQVFAMLVAAGTPGMTYLVMARMHRTQIKNITDNCTKCRAALDEKIEDLDTSMEVVMGRQKKLREEDLPDKYVTRREHEACRKERETVEDKLWDRVFPAK